MSTNLLYSVVFVHEKLKIMEHRPMRFVPRIGDFVDITDTGLPTVCAVILCPKPSRLEDLREVTGKYVPTGVDAIVFLEHQ